ncbi:RDD family protein [Amphritea japonica]|uniref:RDD domain-containing protein n=1 Tax=Amphritea japonica ATCC BAA-1530 TaxID=1278309 RepID=A0A7R6PCV3_9GAMM|nr:RDD family protein [Amphritea japonica]BBB26721.1 conserved hypothetical protein [Amphritea japonica ATCC BAA-1530]
MNDDNIYSAPEANLEVTEEFELVLASRWTRFWAALLDTLFLSIVFVPAMYLLGIWDQLMADQLSTMSDILLSALVLVAYIILNSYLLANSGQTIGKKLLNIRVVDFETEELLPFWKIVGVRYIPFFILSQIPAAGQTIGLIDSLFIFKKDKRCLHDLLANTKVVKL